MLSPNSSCSAAFKMMVASGLLKPTTDYKKAYTTQFVKDLKIMP